MTAPRITQIKGVLMLDGPLQLAQGLLVVQVTSSRDLRKAQSSCMSVYCLACHARLSLFKACNCVGSWSSGIAAIFKQKFPEAFEKYEAHCSENKPNDLVSLNLTTSTDTERLTDRDMLLDPRQGLHYRLLDDFTLLWPKERSA